MQLLSCTLNNMNNDGWLENNWKLSKMDELYMTQNKQMRGISKMESPLFELPKELRKGKTQER